MVFDLDGSGPISRSELVFHTDAKVWEEARHDHCGHQCSTSTELPDSNNDGVKSTSMNYFVVIISTQVDGMDENVELRTAFNMIDTGQCQSLKEVFSELR